MAIEHTVDAATGAVRMIGSGGTCAVYRIYDAFRDEFWRTLIPRVTVERPKEGTTLVRKEFEPAGYGLRSTTRITSTGDSLTVLYEALVERSLLRNRIGLCALFPGNLAGIPLIVSHPDATEDEIAFPDLISPHQPCRAIERLAYELDAASVEVGFEGELFEMEDQRNWTDYSYKVYGTPLDLPFPARLEAGTTIEQTITVRLSAHGPAGTSGEATAEAPVRYHRSALPLVGIRGTGAVNGGTGGMPVDYVRRDTFVSDGGDDSPEYAAMPCQRYLWIDAPEDGSAASGANLPGARKTDQWLSIGDPVAATLTARSDATVSGEQSPIPVVGTDGAFAELNRDRPEVGPGEIVTFTMAPQVHDIDDEAVIDNLFGIRSVLESARRIYWERPLGIGLLELTPHFVPPAGDYWTNRELRRTDPRMKTGFALAWLFAAFCEATAAGVEFVTIAESHGTHGVEDHDAVAPIGHLFLDLARLRASMRAEGTDREASLDIMLPPADLSATRLYLMRCVVPERRTIVLAANLERTAKAAVPGSHLPADGSFRARIVPPAAAPVGTADFDATREELTAWLEPSTGLEIPPFGYLFAESGA